MSKLKNTKKGMAKKALSVSLVAAMLATSNVPVWAAEDLFTAGETTAEALVPVVDDTEVFDEAPIEETTPDAQAFDDTAVAANPTIDSRYEVDFKDMPSKMEWDTAKTVEIKVYDTVEKKIVTDNSDIKVRYLDSDGEDTEIGAYNLDKVDADGYAKFVIDFSNIANFKQYVGKELRLQVINTNHPNEEGYAKTSTPFTLDKVTVTGKVDAIFTDKIQDGKPVRYTGKAITSVPKFKFDNVTYTKTISSETEINKISENYNIVGNDLVNAWEVSQEALTGITAIDNDLYQGNIEVKFRIYRKQISNQEEFAENVGVTLPSNEYLFTGSAITIPSTKISVTNKLSNESVTEVTGDVSLTSGVTNVGNYTPGAWINMTEGTLKNFEMTGAFNSVNNGVNSGNKNYHMSNIGTVVVKSRDLSDTANTKIVIDDVALTYLPNNDVDANALLGSNVHIYDAEGNSLDTLKNGYLTLSLGTTGNENLPVEYGKTYTVTIEPTTKAASDKNVINKATASFKVVNQDLNTATFEKEGSYQDAVRAFTGEQITLGITKDNFKKKLGNLYYHLNDNESSTKLTEGIDYSTDIKFGENTNVGVGTITFEGLGSFAGSKKVITFKIGKRNVADADVKVAKKVVINPLVDEASEYGIVPELVVKFKDADDNNKEKTVTVPSSDYKVEATYENNTGNVVGNKVVTSAVLTNKNSNFNFTKVSGKTEIANKAISDEDIIMNKTTYTYTGAEVALDYKVVVDGVELEKGVDYDEVVTNGTNVGDGILTITGKGDYDKTGATAKFTITPADTKDVKVTLKIADSEVYDGTQHKPGADKLSITLNGNDVSSQFKLTYPTSKTANINAGNGTVTLTPIKSTKNFTGTADATFVISPATLEGGTLVAYDAKESKVQWWKENSDQPEAFRFTYDGTAKSYAKTLYKPAPATDTNDKKVVTANDYEIRYVDNVHGKDGYKSGRAHALVIATGNYKAGRTYTCEDGTVIKNVVLDETFMIDRLAIHKSNVTVENGVYAGGFDVSPKTTINYNGQILANGVDYEVEFAKGQNRKDVTNGKTLTAYIVGKGGYYLADASSSNAKYEYIWGIDKFDLANAEIIVSGTDAAPVIKVMNGSVMLDANKDYDLEVKDGKVTVTAKATSENYTGTQTVDIKHELEKPETPMISSVDVTGNTAKINLSGNCEGATGYDYVISKNRDCITAKDYDKINKNILTTSTNVNYVQQGTYYAYCHAWKRDENGKKVFSGWSNAYPFSVTAITPDQSVITKVSVSGNTVKVTYTKANNATGYDIVLGSAQKKVNGELRPVEYGTLVKKVTNGNTVTATFKNVKKGTYYAGLHAYNRTSEDGKKVFSPWSNIKTVKVK